MANYQLGSIAYEPIPTIHIDNFISKLYVSPTESPKEVQEFFKSHEWHSDAIDEIDSILDDAKVHQFEYNSRSALSRGVDDSCVEFDDL